MGVAIDSSSFIVWLEELIQETLIRQWESCPVMFNVDHVEGT